MGAFPDVVCVPCAVYAPDRVRGALEAAIAPFGGLDWVKPGMRIGVKANLVSAMSPDSAVTTLLTSSPLGIIIDAAARATAISGCSL